MLKCTETDQTGFVQLQASDVGYCSDCILAWNSVRKPNPKYGGYSELTGIVH